MAAFLSTGVFAGWVLWPARVLFAVDADRVEEELLPYREDPAAYLLEAAHGLHGAYRENQEVIERREIVFRFALSALGAETVLWALAIPPRRHAGGRGCRSTCSCLRMNFRVSAPKRVSAPSSAGSIGS